MSASVNITVVEHFQDTWQNTNLSSKEKVIKYKGWNLLFLEEDAGVLNVEHLDRLEYGEVQDAIGPDDVGLLIVPFDLKSILLLT